MISAQVHLEAKFCIMEVMLCVNEIVNIP